VLSALELKGTALFVSHEVDKNLSLASFRRSPLTRTVTVCELTPGANVSRPLVETKSDPAEAVSLAVL